MSGRIIDTQKPVLSASQWAATRLHSSNSPGSFPFALSEAEEERAARLHRESIIFDMLSMYAGGNIFSHYPASLRGEFEDMVNRTPDRSALMIEVIFWPFEMALSGRDETLRDWLLGSGLTCGAFDIDILSYRGGDPLQYGWEERLHRYLQMPWLRQVRTALDVRQAKRDGKLGLYAYYQPIAPMTRDIAAFDRAYAKGLRSFMLTYNRMDHIGVGCTERVDAGLSMFGVDVVKRCNDLGIVVDVSHCGHLTTMDACHISRKPVTANHSAARSVYDHPRGKTDDALKAIADTGGVIGILCVPYFLSDRRDATIDIMLDHIDYVVNLVGWQHVGIGTDWPMQMPDDVLLNVMGGSHYTREVGWGPDHWRDVTARLAGYEDCRDLPNITRGLVARGYSNEQARGILGENALRVFEAVCG